MKVWQVQVGAEFKYRGLRYVKDSRLNGKDVYGQRVQFHREAEVDDTGSNRVHDPIRVTNDF